MGIIKEFLMNYDATTLYCYVCGDKLDVYVRANNKTGIHVLVYPCHNGCHHPYRGSDTMKVKNKEIELNQKIKNNDPQIEQDKDNESTTDRPTNK
jgi:hypothetical protein